MMNWHVFLRDKKMLKESYVLLVSLLMLDSLITADGKYSPLSKLSVSNSGTTSMFHSFRLNRKSMRSTHTYLKKEIHLC